MRFRKILFFLLILFATNGFSQKERVVLQGFWWDYRNDNYPNQWYNYLSDLAPSIKALGIDAVWIPPSVKNGSNGNGYSPFDQYDLGDKYQKGTTETRLGTKNDYLRMVAVMHANGIEVIQDIVLNHTDQAGSMYGSGGQDPVAWDDYTTSQYKNFRYACYSTPATDESSSDYLAREGRWSKNWQNFHPNSDHNTTSDEWTAVYWGPDNCFYSNAYGQSSNALYNPSQYSDYMRTEAREWIIWLKKQTGVDGFRLDAVKHFPSFVTEDLLYNLQYNAGWASGGSDMFAVGEYVGSVNELDSWCTATQDRSGTFDFSLRQELKNVVDQFGNYNLGNLVYYQQTNTNRTVPFVNNHDTFRPIVDADGNYIGWDSSNELGGGHIDPFDPRLSLCYAIIFAVDGSPQVFFEDMFNVGGLSSRYSHKPTDTTDLPIREDLANILWCRQNLDFMSGSIKIRHKSNDHLIIERSGKAIISINDNWDQWQSKSIKTDFADGTQLHDYSGANSNDIYVSNGGYVEIWTPPCDGNNIRKGYSIWGQSGISDWYVNVPASTTQEWEMANDLGDSHELSLQQGGAIPAYSDDYRTVGKIFSDKNKEVSLELYPEDATQSITLEVYHECDLLAGVSGKGNLQLLFTPSDIQWLTLKAKNTYATNLGQKARIKATYEAPANASTFSYPSNIECNNKVVTDMVTSKISNPNITIYPNPNSGVFQVMLPNTTNTPLQVYIYNALGIEVYNNKFTGNRILIDDAYLAKGVYLLNISSNKINKYQYLIIE